MILYSIIPAELVFSGYENESKYIEMDYMGEKVEVMPLSNSEYRINRLISTSPKAYLNPAFQPGTIIKGTF